MAKITINKDRLRELLISQVKAEAARRIVSRWPDWKQRNAALGLLAPDEVEACKKWIAAVREASELIEQDIRDSTDPVNFDVVKSTRWPKSA